jgi:histone acetyltransferase 1
MITVAFVKESDFEHSATELDPNWTPPGSLYEAFEGPDGHYEVWKGSLEDPAVRQLNSRIQILVPLFIEGGSYIGQKDDAESTEPDLSDADRWTLFFLYRKDVSTDDASKSSYIFVGYSTIYRFYWFHPTPPPSPTSEWELPSGNTELTELPCRTRLSQFVILPPFQGKGHGVRLYKTIFSHYHDHAQTQEFTVEDPNEAFDDLRDICDLAFLRTLPEFNSLGFNTEVAIPKSGPLPQLIVGGDQLEVLQRKSKIASRQFGRVVEMHLMSQLPDSVRPTMDLDRETPEPTAEDKKKEKIWQLIAKQRLYRHNRDALSQLELEERIEKLSDVLAGVELGHARILAAYDRYMEHESSPTANGKRKAEGLEGEGSSKKPRLENA